jgi:hypothetical protein
VGLHASAQCSVSSRDRHAGIRARRNESPLSAPTASDVLRDSGPTVNEALQVKKGKCRKLGPCYQKQQVVPLGSPKKQQVVQLVPLADKLGHRPPHVITRVLVIGNRNINETQSKPTRPTYEYYPLPSPRPHQPLGIIQHL